MMFIRFLFLLLAISLHAKVVLITGASRGIGLATAESLTEKGYKVYGTVRTPLLTHEKIHFEMLDVTDSSDIERVINHIIEEEGRIDILINNAAYGLVGPLEGIEIEEMQEQFNVNFLGAMRMCQAVLPHMRKQQAGHIINISSYQGVWGLPYGSGYSASKAALEAMSEALSIEVLPWNIRVSIVEPGHTATQFLVKMGSRNLEENPYREMLDAFEKVQNQKNTHPEFLGLCQSPKDVAEFLCQVIEDPDPKLRYQTSPESQKMVLIKLKDLDGKEYFEIAKDIINSIFEKSKNIP